MRKKAWTVCLILLASFASRAHARTWFIRPDGTGDAPTIQAGVDSTAVGDTVLLADGVFTGPGNWDVKYRRPDWNVDIVIRSASGNPDSCVIDAGGIHQGLYVTGDMQPTLAIEGIAITHATKGLYLFGDGDPKISNCRFVESDFGVDCFGPWPSFVGCEFSRNRRGAGVSGSGFADCTFVDCMFADNLEAGLTVSTETQCAVTRCMFSGNEGVGVGLGEATVVFTDCDFTKNLQGAIGMAASYIKAVNCRFIENSNPYGGGCIYGYSFSYPFSFDLVNCLFAGNSAPQGGAIYIYQNSYGWMQRHTISGCTFYGNSASEGAVIYAELRSDPNELEVAVDHSIIAGSAGGPTITCKGRFPLQVDCSDIYGNAGGDWVDRIAERDTLACNFSADPMFCNRLEDVFTLQDGSPCLPQNNPSGELIGALGQGCETVTPRLELHPLSLSEHSHGVLTAILRDSKTVRVKDINLSTVFLNGRVSPLGVVSDTSSSSVDAPGSKLHRNSEVTLRFAQQDVIETLRPFEKGDVRPVNLTAIMRDGSTMSVSAEVRMVAATKAPPGRDRPPAGDFFVLGFYGELLMLHDSDEPTRLMERDYSRTFLNLANHPIGLLILEWGKWPGETPSNVSVFDVAERRLRVLSMGGRLSYVMSMAVAKNGDIFVSAYGDPGRIIRVKPDDGSQLVVYTRPGWYGPRGMVFDNNDHLLVAQSDGNNPQNTGVLRIDLAAGTEKFLTHHILSPSGLILDVNGEIVVTDWAANAVVKVDHQGATEVLSKGHLIQEPRSIERDRNGNYMVTTDYGRIVMVDRDNGDQHLVLESEVLYPSHIVTIPNAKKTLAQGEDPSTTALTAAAPPVTPGIASVTPNPFNPTTRIRFGVVREGAVDITVYDVAGRVVERLVHETMPAGEHEVTWNAGGVASGVYFARLTTPDGKYTSKLVVMK